MPAQAQHLRRGFLVTGAGFAAIFVTVLALVVGSRISKSLRDQANERGREVAFRVAGTVTQYLTERRREIVSLASQPELATAVRALDDDAVRRGLDRMDIPTLERRFAGRRQLGEEGPLLRYLRSYTELSDFAEVFVTERHGFVALASGPTRRSFPVAAHQR